MVERQYGSGCDGGTLEVPLLLFREAPSLLLAPKKRECLKGNIDTLPKEGKIGHCGPCNKRCKYRPFKQPDYVLVASHESNGYFLEKFSTAASIYSIASVVYVVLLLYAFLARLVC